MKKFGVCVLLLIIIIGGVFGYFGVKKIIANNKINEIKKGWYVEITYKDPINVRTINSTKGDILGEVNSGEVYEVLDIDTSSDRAYYWYKINYNNKEGWIASGKKNHWVNDVNNPNDIAVPVIKYYDDVYKVMSIKDINYKHLEIIEDSNDYTITHQVYHELKPKEYIDQYWILYTVTDKAGKSSSKLQKIEFAEKPSEEEVLDFSLYRK